MTAATAQVLLPPCSWSERSLRPARADELAVGLVGALAGQGAAVGVARATNGNGE